MHNATQRIWMCPPDSARARARGDRPSLSSLCWRCACHGLATAVSQLPRDAPVASIWPTTLTRWARRNVLTYRCFTRGFGFVAFQTKEAAEKAMEAMNQAEIGGRTVNVNFAKPREARTPRFNDNKY